ncbi:hypothetical protein F3K44_31525 [Bacillus megaterium]|nr:hypothetical protein [Priestia megaterium]
MLVMLFGVKIFTCEKLGNFTTLLNFKFVVKPKKELVYESENNRAWVSCKTKSKGKIYLFIKTYREGKE